MIEEYTVGDDRELDMRLARYDVEGSLAHIAMLEKIGLLTAEELSTLTAGGPGAAGERQRQHQPRLAPGGPQTAPGLGALWRHHPQMLASPGFFPAAVK